MARLQGQSEETIGASPARIWDVLEDPGRLPEWVPVVEKVTEHAGREEAGSVRRCEVAIGSRHGYIVERCLESIPGRRLHHAVDDDSLGFTRMFREYSFTLELEPRGQNATLVISKTFYEPRGMLARLMNALLMRRRFGAVRKDLLNGLKRVAETIPPTTAQPGQTTSVTRAAG
jgi:carbon monoxide dehydrogenase subunit G